MNREQIINQYISVYEGHAMEKEELEIMLNGFADDIVNNLHPSLPDNLEEAVRHVYESWMGGTMDDVRRDMVELGKVLNVRKEEGK